jgi:hypothetical protein
MLAQKLLRTLLFGVISIVGLNPPKLSAADLTVTLDPANPGHVIPADFTGLSYEITQVLPARAGKYYFTPTNQPLIGLFKTLGIKSLRVGGNTADRDTVPIPTTADADNLFAFAQSAGIKAIYTVRLDGGDPQADAAMVKYLIAHYPSNLECITIGNEPNKQFSNAPSILENYSAYRSELVKFMSTISAAAPDAKFCGPSVMHTVPEWTAAMAGDFAHDQRIDFLTQHYYCGKNGQRATNAEPAQDKLLSPDMLTNYEYFYYQFMPTVISNGLTCRIEETSSYSRGGARGTSDVFASALWAVDYLHWWAEKPGVRGFNFHMGNIYGAFVDAANGYSVRPLSYGIKAFNLGGTGRIVPATVKTNPDGLNLTAYGVLDGTNLFVTLINKEHSDGARDATVRIDLGAPFSGAVGMLLRAPEGTAAKTKLTLGGSGIGGDGKWDGYWTPLTYATQHNGVFEIKVPVASVLVIKFNLK